MDVGAGDKRMEQAHHARTTMNTNADTEHAPTATTVPVERYIAAMDAAEMLWTVVANASNSDWTKQSDEWQQAARRWRDAYLIELQTYRALMQTWPVVDATFTSPVRGASAVDAPPAPNPPADAPEPPWVVAARHIEKHSDSAVYCAASEVIKKACMAHTDALAQERDRFYRQMLDANGQWEKDHEAVCDERDQALAERDVANLERETLRATVARLTAECDKLCVANVGFQTAVEQCASERNRLRAALRTISEHPTHEEIIDGQHCDFAHQQLARAALAPTQKEEA